MKYLRILFLFGLALFCGSVSSHAQGFHGQILDPPSCVSVSSCTLLPPDVGVPFPVTFNATECSEAGVVLSPVPAEYGCFFGSNTTGETLTSFTLDVSASEITSCDTDVTGVTKPPVAFGVSGCNADGKGGFLLNFSGGGIDAGTSFIIIEEGIVPGDITASATANAPEPDSLLLLSTGTMMMGLYLTGRTRLFAFLKKK
jgi:hypothetical protein